MNNNATNAIIENCPSVYRSIMQFGCVVALHAKQEYIEAGVYTNELCNLFEQFPYGETDKYQWITRRVDQLVNVTIWKIK